MLDKNDIYYILLRKKVQVKKQYVFCVCLVCSISAVCFVFLDYIGAEVVAFILLLMLSFVAMFFDILPVLLTALLSALIWDYFFLLPHFNLRVGNTEDKIMLSMYFVIAMINAVLTFKVRQMEKIARQREEKANALKLYDTLFNSLSHEFRTPIATIVGAADNLMEGRDKLTDDDLHELVSQISSASFRLNQQVENLLNISRLESGYIKAKKEWCDIGELIYAVIKHLYEELKDHKLVISIKDSLPLCKLDHGLIEHVLYNLISNAVRYTPAGSLISISTDLKDEKLVIIVEDNGNGFPEEAIEKVFEKFYRVQYIKNGGTGLGLSIAKGFVEAHNGKIDLINKPSKGAKFTITIPVEKFNSNLS